MNSLLRPSLITLVALFGTTLPLHAGRSNSLLDVSPDGTRLLVVNADNGTVSVVDTGERKVLHEIAVGDKPEGVTWIGKGPLAAVTVYREDLLVFIDTVKGQVLQKLAVQDEPYGIASDEEGKKAWVTHEYPGVVSEIDLAERKVVRTLKAGANPRGVALSPDGKRLYVSEFYSASLHAIDLASGNIVDTWRGQTRDNLSRSIVLHPTLPKAYLPHIRSRIDVIDGTGSIMPQVTIYDTVPANDTKRRTSVAMDTFNGLGVPTNPWDAAITADGKKMFVIYAATNDMNVCQVVHDEYKDIQALGGLQRVGQNPRAVRISPDGKTLYISLALDFAVAVYDVASVRRLGTITVCSPPKTPEWVKGKILFSTGADFRMTGPRWVSCASCHPDGHSDARVWQNPEGLRKTPPLMGLAHTHPLHWSADRDESQDFEYTIRSRLMRGSGLVRGGIKFKQGFNPTELDEKMSERSEDLDALAIYTNSFEFTLSPHNPAPGKLSAEAERGKKLFFNNEVGCATCHSGPYYSDSTLTKPFKLHDVGTGRADKTEKIGTKYDTPTLLGVYRSAPYLHDGSAKTLHDVVTTTNKDDKHGKTSHLKKDEIEDLVAFLKALPYDKPPSQTPNTVKYRVIPRKE